MLQKAKGDTSIEPRFLDNIPQWLFVQKAWSASHHEDPPPEAPNPIYSAKSGENNKNQRNLQTTPKHTTKTRRACNKTDN